MEVIPLILKPKGSQEGPQEGPVFCPMKKKDLDTEKNLIMMEIEDARTENTLDLIVPYCRG